MLKKFWFSSISLLMFFANDLLIAQSHSIQDYLTEIPVEVFEKTREGITRKELKKLKQQKASKNWNIDEITSSKACLTSNSLTTVVELVLLQRDKQGPILLSYIEEDEMLMIETWDLESSPVGKISILPDLTVNDFFDPQDAFTEPERYQKDIFYHLEHDHLMAGLHTNMKPDYHGKEIDYMIELEWSGEEFLVKKVKME